MHTFKQYYTRLDWIQIFHEKDSFVKDIDLWL